MPDLESIQPGEEGEETESPSLENEKIQELNNATQEPGTRIEQTRSIEESEAIESTFVELMSDLTDVPEIPESDLDTLPHTAVGKGPVPTISSDLSDTTKEQSNLESLQEESLTDLDSESEKPVDLNDEDIKRLLGDN